MDILRELLTFTGIFAVCLVVVFWRKSRSKKKRPKTWTWQPDVDEQKAKLIDTNYNTLNGR